MSYELVVYARGEPTSVPDLLAAMSARRSPVAWREDPLWAGQDAGDCGWVAALVAPEANASPTGEVSVSCETIDDASRRRAAESYGDRLGEHARAVVSAARRRYAISGPGEIPLALADALAQLADGVIVDGADNQVYERSAWRERHGLELG